MVIARADMGIAGNLNVKAGACSHRTSLLPIAADGCGAACAKMPLPFQWANRINSVDTAACSIAFAAVERVA